MRYLTLVGANLSAIAAAMEWPLFGTALLTLFSISAAALLIYALFKLMTTPPDPTDPTWLNLTALIEDYIVVDPGTVQATDSLSSLGIDSLDLTKLILEIEDLFEIELADDVAGNCHTVADLYEAILNAQDS